MDIPPLCATSFPMRNASIPPGSCMLLEFPPWRSLYFSGGCESYVTESMILPPVTISGIVSSVTATLWCGLVNSTDSPDSLVFSPRHSSSLNARKAVVYKWLSMSVRYEMCGM